MSEGISGADICLLVTVFILVIANIVLACCIGVVLPNHMKDIGWYYIGDLGEMSDKSKMDFCKCAVASKTSQPPSSLKSTTEFVETTTNPTTNASNKSTENSTVSATVGKTSTTTNPTTTVLNKSTENVTVSTTVGKTPTTTNPTTNASDKSSEGKRTAEVSSSTMQNTKTETTIEDTWTKSNESSLESILDKNVPDRRSISSTDSTTMQNAGKTDEESKYPSVSSTSTRNTESESEPIWATIVSGVSDNNSTSKTVEESTSDIPTNIP